MIDYLHAFAVGISFSVGVCVGAVLCQLATRRGRKEEIANAKEHWQKVEDRLTKSMKAHLLIATELEKMRKQASKN